MALHVIRLTHDGHSFTPVNFDFLLQQTVDSKESLLFILKSLIFLHDLKYVLLERTNLHLFVVETLGYIFLSQSSSAKLALKL